MRRAALALCALAACNSVPKPEAEAFLAEVEEIAASHAPQGMHTNMLMSACGDAPSCAGGCAEVFKAAPKYAEADQRMLIAQCSGDFREATSGPAKLSLGTWLRRYIGHYIKRARTQLDSSEQARLDAAIQKLGN
jgi:hypothetical protein